MDKLFVQALHQAFEDAAPLFITAELPPVQHIDKFRGQTLNPEQFEGLCLPAIFYEMRCDWVKSNKLYSGSMAVTFHIVQDATWETANISTNKAIGLVQIDLLNAIRAVLDSIKSPNTGRLTRVADTPIDTNVVIYDALTYQCQYTAPTIEVGKFIETVTPDLGLVGNLVTNI